MTKEELISAVGSSLKNLRVARENHVFFLAQDEIDRNIRLVSQEVRINTVILDSDNSMELPTDFLEVARVEPIDAEFYVEGNRFYAEDSDYPPTRIVYFRRLGRLARNEDSNNLSKEYPSIYILALSKFVALHLQDRESLALYKQELMDAFEDVRVKEKDKRNNQGEITPDLDWS